MKRIVFNSFTKIAWSSYRFIYISYDESSSQGFRAESGKTGF